MKKTATTLVEVLREHSVHRADSVLYEYLVTGDADGPRQVWTFGRLERRARAIAAALLEAGAPGERALLLYPPGLDFAAAFMGCLFAAAVAVPAYPPQPNRRERSLPGLLAVVRDARPALILTTTQLGTRLGDLLAASPELDRLRRLATDRIDDALAEDWSRPEIDGATLAFLQYTSGSTGDPKGVMVTHRNLLANQEMIRRAFGHGCDETVVSWLPLYHDMGLIGMLLQPLYVGGRCVLMSPFAFAQRPSRWLEAVSRFRATTSGGPNFAYDECCRRVRDADLGKLDLSSWKVAFNGAEPVRRATLARFAERFAPCGFDPTAFLPCYGLAESTLLVSGIGPGEDPLADRPRAAVSCGEPAGDGRVAVVDAESRRRLDEGQVGEIWVSGPHTARGYWSRPEETKATFEAFVEGSGEGPFLRTGDLGFLRGGALHVTGRLKDLVIVRGRNHYPQDIERTVEECHPGVRPGGGAAFSVDDGGEERLVVMAEVKPRVDREAIAAAIREAVSSRHEVEPWAVELVRPRSLPRTSSGKIRRSACREQFLVRGRQAAPEIQGRQAAPAPSPWRERAGVRGGDSPDSSGGRSCEDVRAWMVERLARRSGRRTESIDVEAPFSDFGLDSRELVGLSGELEEAFDVPLSPTLLYEYPTIATLSRFLAGEESPSPVVEAPSGGGDGVAIVGIGCRFPGGADTPERFWDLLRDGVDAVTDVPPGRWDEDVPVRRGGFLDRVDGFDAAFFGISPREAVELDPQQRLLLEVAWEALEDAGQVPAKLEGAAVGVYLGLSTSDYARRHLHSGIRERIGPYSATGSAASAAAGRLSYFFRWRGPSLAVDTACSSSLVAVHLACQSLGCGESDLALAGGVSLMLSPEPAIALGRAGMLAPDGRCKTFDARADGYGRGEGCGLVVLKRLADARRDGDPVVAVVRGSAVNQDGLSNGLTAPDGAAQQDVVRRALAAAGVEPHRVGYVEAHGTGTELGDPIELHALARCLDRGRDEPLAVGSVKTNIGHLEAAAGIAGLIKTALALRFGEIPPHLHLETPSPRIAWGELNVRIPTARRPLRGAAGVSSFGFSGTNAHVVLEAAAVPVEPAAAPGAERSVHVLTLSARSESALREQARRVGDHLARHPELALADVCFSANVLRARFEHRLAVAAASPEALRSELAAFARGEGSGVRLGRARRSGETKTAFLFTGQGVRIAGAGAELYEVEPVFRRRIDEADEILRPRLGVSLAALLASGAQPEADTPWTQPGLFALECALAELWRSWGVVPDAVAGHSVGEYAAAHAAGVFSFEDGLTLLYERERLMLELPDPGAMAVVEAGEDEVEREIARRAAAVSIAAVNGPRQVVVSGAVGAVTDVAAVFAARGSRTRRLEARRAFHSALMEPILDRFHRAASGVRYAAAKIPLISGLTGQPVGEGIAHADYWRYHLREPVRFYEGVRKLRDDGVDVFLELGPEAPLTSLAAEAMNGEDVVCVGTLPVPEALAALELRGVSVDWRGIERPWPRRRVALPTYPFERRRFWLEPPESTSGDLAGDAEDPLAGWFYKVEWREAPPPAPDPRPGRWLLLADEGGAAVDLAHRLKARGQEVTTLAFEASERLAEALDEGPWRGVVHLWTLDAPPPERMTLDELELFVYDRGALPVLELVRAWHGHQDAGRVWLVTSKAAGAPLGGLGLSLSLERPELRGGSIELDAGADPETLADTLLEGGDEDRIALRHRRRYVARLLADPAAPRRRGPAVRDDRAYLVTGGLGGLGLVVARWLVGRGARHLVLTRRRPPDDRDRQIAAAFESLGVAVTVAAADVSRRDEMEPLLARLEQPLGGVVHAAGVLRPAPLEELGDDAFRALCRAKVEGTWCLHQLTRDQPLDFFVLFSSAAAVWGSRGLGPYAAANRFLGAVAEHRRALGLPATSIDWGWWKDGGMGDAEAEAFFERLGLAPLPSPLGLEALERTVGERTDRIVARVDWSVFKPIYEARRRRPLLSEVGAEEASPSAGSSLEALAPEERRRHLRELLERELRRVLALPADARIDDRQDLLALGLDSILAVQLLSALRSDLGRAVSPSSVFRHPTLASLTDFLAGAAEGDPETEPVAVRTTGPARLSFGQQRLWFLRELASGVPLYNLFFRLEIAGRLDAAALERALGTVVGRHEILRSALRLIDGEPRQIVEPDVDWRLPRVDLRALGAGIGRGEARRLASRLSRERFDLAEPPLFRLLLLRLGESEHVLAVAQHHAVTDGWSLRLFLRELALLYRGDALPDLGLQYADFAEWQHRAWEAGTLAPRLEDWRRALADLEPLRLPTDRARPGSPSFRGGVVSFGVDAGVREGLEALAQQCRRTPFMALTAALAALLGRWSGQRDFGLATVVAGRDRPELHGTMGFFVNTLVLRTPTPPTATFAEALDAIGPRVIEALTGQDVPYDRVVEALRADRRPADGGDPPVGVCFMLESIPAAEVEVPGLELRTVVDTPDGAVGGTAKFDLTLSMADVADGMTAALEYATDLFDRTTIERLARRFRTLLRAVAADPDQRLSRLDLVSEPERQQLLRDWNDTAAVAPRAVTVHELVERQARRSCDAIAVVFEERRLSYGELDARADRRALRLRSAGVGPESLVGVGYERSSEMIEAVLAVLKAGGAYVPLDPRYPAKRLAEIVEDSRLELLLPSADSFAIRLLPPLPLGGEGTGRRAVTAGNLAYMIYTSGSTGRPKGVQVTHRALVHFLAAMARETSIAPGDELLSITTPTFDIAALEIFLPLAVGARVRLVPDAVTADGRALARTLRAARSATRGTVWMQATPTTWRMLAAAWEAGEAPGSFTALCGGEALTPDLARTLASTAERVWNVYGPTETTVWSALARLPAAPRRVLIGRPLGNTCIRVLDSGLRSVPAGAVGELGIGGGGLARGYGRRPALTAERFVPDPYGSIPGERLYRTGDLGRRLGDGTLECLGRFDHQVKLRGHRIELGEIEALLSRAAEVRECAVAVHDLGAGGPRMVAYVVSSNGTQELAERLRRHLRDLVPETMIPALFVELESLPRTANRKLDRRRLPVPEGVRPELGAELVLPSNPTQERLAALWSEVLGVRPVGVHDGFFELGGTSLEATLLVSRVRSTFEVDLPLAAFFQATTVARLAEVLERQAVRAPLAAIRRVARDRYRRSDRG